MQGTNDPTLQATRPRVALALHGRLSSWLGTKASDQAWLNASRRSLARLAADSYHRFILEPNAPHFAGVYMHTWNPELAPLWNSLYAPKVSRHDPIQPGLRSVASQHLSMKLVLALVPSDEGFSLVMVARLDLLFFSPVPLVHLATTAAGHTSGLWLPSNCQHNLRIASSEREGLYESCGCGRRSKHRRRCQQGLSGLGSLWESPDLTRARASRTDSKIDLNRTRVMEHSLFVNDWWFVATLDVARSFGWLHSSSSPGGINGTYVRGLRRRGFRGPPWGHFFWAHHVTHVLPQLPTRVSVQFAPTLNGRDFILARFVRFGSACEAAVRTPHQTIPITLNATRHALAARWIDPILSDQCPPRLQRGTRLMCPFYSPACGAQAARRALEAIWRAEAALQAEGLNLSHAYDHQHEVPRAVMALLAAIGAESRIMAPGTHRSAGRVELRASSTRSSTRTSSSVIRR